MKSIVVFLRPYCNGKNGADVQVRSGKGPAPYHIALMVDEVDCGDINKATLKQLLTTWHNDQGIITERAVY